VLFSDSSSQDLALSVLGPLSTGGLVIGAVLLYRASREGFWSAVGVLGLIIATLGALSRIRDIRQLWRQATGIEEGSKRTGQQVKKTVPVLEVAPDVKGDQVEFKGFRRLKRSLSLKAIALSPTSAGRRSSLIYDAKPLFDE
jgi:hypothetical protein